MLQTISRISFVSNFLKESLDNKFLLFGTLCYWMIWDIWSASPLNATFSRTILRMLYVSVFCQTILGVYYDDVIFHASHVYFMVARANSFDNLFLYWNRLGGIYRAREISRTLLFLGHENFWRKFTTGTRNNSLFVPGHVSSIHYLHNPFFHSTARENGIRYVT